MWQKKTVFFIEPDEHGLFAMIIPVEESGDLAWYVIDDKEHDLFDSGSDDTLGAAEENAERALKRASKFDRSVV